MDMSALEDELKAELFERFPGSFHVLKSCFLYYVVLCKSLDSVEGLIARFFGLNSRQDRQGILHKLILEMFAATRTTKSLPQFEMILDDVPFWFPIAEQFEGHVSDLGPTGSSRN